MVRDKRARIRLSADSDASMPSCQRRANADCCWSFEADDQGRTGRGPSTSSCSIPTYLSKGRHRLTVSFDKEGATVQHATPQITDSPMGGVIWTSFCTAAFQARKPFPRCPRNAPKFRSWSIRPDPLPISLGFLSSLAACTNTLRRQHTDVALTDVSAEHFRPREGSPCSTAVD